MNKRKKRISQSVNQSVEKSYCELNGLASVGVSFERLSNLGSRSALRESIFGQIFSLINIFIELRDDVMQLLLDICFSEKCLQALVVVY